METGASHERTEGAPRPSLARRGLALVALMRQQLRRSGGGLIGTTFGALAAIGFASGMLVLRVEGGAGASFDSILRLGARTLPWLSALPLGLSAARDRRVNDRAEGIELLGFARGFGAGDLGRARLVAAVLEGARLATLPLLLLGLLAASLTGDAWIALGRVGLAFRVAAAAMAAGAGLSLLGALCGLFGRGYGRALFVFFILVPWALAELGAYRSLSVPGAVQAAFDLAFGAARGAR